MAKKITGYVKLQINAGKATPAPPVGPALGSQGVNIMGFCKEFNERTKNQVGLVIPVVITVYADVPSPSSPRLLPPRSLSRRPATWSMLPASPTSRRSPA